MVHQRSTPEKWKLTMITSKEAEKLAHTVIQDYVNACQCNTLEDVGNALMKLASMCGLGMCATVGQQEAVARLQGTTDYIAATQEGKNWKSEAIIAKGGGLKMGMFKQEWRRFSDELFRSSDAPYPGMIEAFEKHYGQSWTDREWRDEARTWAAAWKAAVRHADVQSTRGGDSNAG